MLATALVTGGLSPPSFADHEDGAYELPALAMWPDAQLEVLIVPPAHGQILNAESGVLNGGDTGELTPWNTYLKAIEDAIGAWDVAIETLGPDWLREAYEVKVYVLGRDVIPPETLTDPDVVVVTDEEAAGALGTAVRLNPCVVRMSKSSILSFTYADMYNVTAQEFGHCLGLQHVGSQGGVDPTSDQKHPEHDVMNGFYTHLIGDAGTHLHCISNLDVVGLEFAFSFSYVDALHTTTGGPGGTTYMPVGAYGTVCDPPPSDWRVFTPPPVPTTNVVMTSRIEAPADGAVIKAKKFSEISGTASSSAPRPFAVEVAILRANLSGGCDWWDEETASFRTRDCYSPVWLETDGSENWTFRSESDLPTGDLQLWSRATERFANEACCEQGRNKIEITVKQRKGTS